MRLHLTRHVLDEIGWRGLKRAWVERVAIGPDWTECSRWRRDVQLCFGRIVEADSKVLRVTTIDEENVRVVITAHFDRRATQIARKIDADDV